MTIEVLTITAEEFNRLKMIENRQRITDAMILELVKEIRELKRKYQIQNDFSKNPEYLE